MLATVRTIDSNRFKGTVFFSLTVTRKFSNWGGVKDPKKLQEYLALLQAPDEPSEVNGNETPNAPAIAPGSIGKGNKVKSRKPLLQSKAYEAIVSFQNETKDRLVGDFGRASQSRIKDGLYVVALPLVESFEQELAAAQAKLENELVPAFLMDYPEAIGRAETMPVKKGGLGPLFDRNDYPDASLLSEAFGFDWQWLALSVPGDLPEALRGAAEAKLEKQFTDAANEITQALRAGFLTVIKHAKDKLTPGEDGKPRIFRDTLVGNIQAFIDSFNARNVMGDAELAQLVEQARGILTNGGNKLTPDALRKDKGVAEAAQSQFAAIADKLGAMVDTQASRAFGDFDDEPAPVAK